MEKVSLERFISKYNLGGSLESVILKSNKTLSVRAISEDKNVLAEVSAKLDFPTGEFGVYETRRLRSILGVLDDAFTVKLNDSNGKTTGITFADGSTKATFVLADASVIPPVPDLKNLPPFDVTITIDEKFITTFTKAKNALSEVETVTFLSDGKADTASVVLGYSNNNSNRIDLEVKTDRTSKLAPINFSANYLREILTANKDAKNGTLKVSSKGLALAEFDADGFKSTYYLVQLVIS